MTYDQYSKIEASDYFNIISGGLTPPTATSVNGVWGTGSGGGGYGQTPLTSVTAGNKISHVEWAALFDTLTAMQTHQGTTPLAYPTPSTGDKIQYTSTADAGRVSVVTHAFNAALQGTTSSTTATNNNTWTDYTEIIQKVSFASGDAARYFFNAGGQIAITFSSPSGTGINALMNSLSTACGTVILSYPSSSLVTIAGVSYRGITKIGGSGTVNYINQNCGYYSLTTTDTLMFNQLATGTPAGYLSSNLSVYMYTSTPNASGNNDNGKDIFIRVKWDEIPNGLTVSAGTAATITIRPPYSSPTTLPTASWGTPVVTTVSITYA